MAGYDSVRVACRFRPSNQREKNEGSHGSDIIIDILDCNKQVKFNDKKKTHTFTFDRAFRPLASQEEVFIHTGGLLIDYVLQGINCTLFAYGQTGSGKTHTMEGEIGSLEMEGLIPRMVRKLFDSISSMKEDVKYALRISYVEIYNEKLRDLLDPSLTPRVRGGLNSSNIVIENSHEQYVSSPQQVFELLYAGQSNRSVSSTKMNNASSRSHAVFMLYIDREESSGNKKKSKLLMVDLAGSEKVKKTEAKGALLEEAKNINQSLSTLGNVINALTKGQHHIPYRDSILTRLLSDALGGNSKTMLIIAASPCLFNSEETLSTLRFGKRAKEIKNKIAVNEELSIEQYKARLHAAKLKINSLEKENNILKKKIREIMVISNKHSKDKDLVIKFETIVKNIDLNPISPSNKNIGSVRSSNKKRRNKTTSNIKLNKTKKQNKISRSMSVQINADALSTLNIPSDMMNEYEQEFNILNSNNSLEKDAEILSLKKKLNEIIEELNRAENAERMINDAKCELYEGHLQLREEYDELSEKLKHLELINDTSQTNIERLQTLLDDSNLRRTQEQQKYLSKEKLYINKCDKLHKEIEILKFKQNKNEFNLNLKLRQQQRELLKQNDENKNNNNNNNIMITTDQKETDDTTDKKYKLLQDKYKKMSEILSCYKERDETNFSIRKAWSKHMISLEKALLQQDAVTRRWREQSKAHEQVLKTEIDRLRNNIKHFQQFKRYGHSSHSYNNNNNFAATSPALNPVLNSLNRRLSNSSQKDDDNSSVTSAHSFALHNTHSHQTQIIQPQQIVHSYSQPQPQPTYVHSGYNNINSGGGHGARLANPTYVIPNSYRLIQNTMHNTHHAYHHPHTQSTIQAIPQTVNVIPTLPTHPQHQHQMRPHPINTYVTSPVQPQIQPQHHAHEYNLQ